MRLFDRSQERLRQTIAVLDALHCGAVLVDRAGKIVHANARLCLMMQREAGELLHRRFWDFYAAGEARRLQARFEHGPDVEVEEEAYLPSAGGERLPVIVSSRPLGLTPPLSGHRIFTVIDISRQKQAESRYHEQYREVARLSDTVLEQALDLKHYSRTLEEKVQERTVELREANMDAILMLAVASEARDPGAGPHVLRIERYARAIAREVGSSDGEAERLGCLAILHDVGKIQVPDDILKKPGPLTAEERKAMEYHTIAGERILSRRSFFDTARAIARSHHENWDGSGYPDGLAGEAVPLAARIVHIADVFDALTSPRVYKPAWPLADSVAELLGHSGTMFDPRLVETFRRLLEAGALKDTLALRSSAGESGTLRVPDWR